MEIKIFKKKFQIFLPVKKELLLLHPLWETTKGGKNKEEYVPRHIELTARICSNASLKIKRE
mgnify:CR=1 FL=1